MSRQNINPNAIVQGNHQRVFIAAVHNYQAQHMKAYHDAQGQAETARREGFVEVLTNSAKFMTAESKVTVFLTLTQLEENGDIPDYRSFWLRAALEEKSGSTVSERKTILAELNTASEGLVGSPIRAYLGEKDKELLRELTSEKQIEVDDVKGR